jgi:hypothetical protein
MFIHELLQVRYRVACYLNTQPFLINFHLEKLAMAKTKDRKLKKIHVPAHTKIVNGKKQKVKEHYRSTPD